MLNMVDNNDIVFLANNGHFKILKYLVENGELNIEKYYGYIERMADIYEDKNTLAWLAIFIIS